MKWAGKYEMVDSSHAHDLERAAAFYEFHKGLSKDVADRLAFEDYKRKQMIDAAAYHLDGIDRAKALGDKEFANSHYSMYLMHCGGLGFDHRTSIVPEIQAQRGKFVFGDKFMPHPADSYALKGQSL